MVLVIKLDCTTLEKQTPSKMSLLSCTFKLFSYLFLRSFSYLILLPVSYIILLLYYFNIIYICICSFFHLFIKLKYLEHITRWREDMDFMFEWQEQYLTSEDFPNFFRRLDERSRILPKIAEDFRGKLEDVSIIHERI